MLNVSGSNSPGVAKAASCFSRSWARGLEFGYTGSVTGRWNNK
jgi:hypothetical protein